MTRQEIEQKMDELAREYHDTHDPEIFGLASNQILIRRPFL
jgi:hypothetical protein